MARVKTPAAERVAVKMLTSYASANGVCRAGKVIELNAKEADDLIKNGFAVLSEMPASAPVVESEEDKEDE